MGIVGGRGLRRGPDAFVDQGEAFDARSRGSSAGSGLYLAPDTTLLQTNSTMAMTSGLVYFMPLGLCMLAMRLVAGRIRIIALGGIAGSAISSGLYVFRSEDRSLVLVPKTKFTISGSTAGLITGAIEDGETKPGVFYFAGVLAIGGNPSVASCTSSNGIWNMHTLAGQTRLPPAVQLDGLTIVSTVTFGPMVMFLSQLGVDLL